MSHLRRPIVSRHHPLHVTLRLRAGLASLRTRALFPDVRAALAQAQERFGFRLVHFSVQSNHLHLIVEARDRRALSRGVQGLSVRVARAVNRRLGRKGRIFAERYHARALKTPRAVQFALRYVLLNARKHAGPPGAPACPRAVPSRAAPSGTAPSRAVPSGTAPSRAVRSEAARSGTARSSAVPFGFVDACSSAAWFAGFRRPGELAFGAARVRSEWRASSALPAPVVEPRTWLLRVGHRRCTSFDIDDAPA